MKWEKVSQWYFKSGSWTITWAPNVPYPYGLYNREIQVSAIGFYATLEAAKAAATGRIAA